MKHHIIIAFCLYIGLQFLACKKDEKSTGHNAGQPIVIEKFLPVEGGKGTEILIVGNNFTTDTAQIKVTVNGKAVKLENANQSQILVRLPAGVGTGFIEVSIGNQKGISSDKFNYNFSRVVSTFAGSGQIGFMDGKGTEAVFSFSGSRLGLDVDDQLNVYVADAGNHRIRKIAPDGTVSTLSGNGNLGHVDGPGNQASFQDPYDVAVDAAGNVYVADRRQLYIRKITPQGITSTLIKTNVVGGAQHNSAPYSIAVDKRNGTVYYTDWNWDNGSICQVKPDGTASRIAVVYKPSDITVDSHGNLLVTCNEDHVIKMIKANTWEVSTFAGSGNPGLQDGAATLAKFESPWGIAVDANDNIFVAGNGKGGGASNSNQCIRYIDGISKNVSTYAGKGGDAGYANGLSYQALFDAPTGVAVDKNGTVYVLDANNNRIRKIVAE